MRGIHSDWGMVCGGSASFSPEVDRSQLYASLFLTQTPDLMKYIEIVAASSSRKTLTALAEKVRAHDCRFTAADEDDMMRARFLVGRDRLQETLDALHNLLGAQSTARVVVLEVQSSWPESEEEHARREEAASETREALVAGVSKNAACTPTYLLLVALSTVVASIGLMENNVAVVIGAMVIAPLLGPNLALSLGISLGDLSLVRKALISSISGVALAVALATGIGIMVPMSDYSGELLSRTSGNLGSAALALASGAAAALSLTTGLSSVLVGVMVAVALLPPAATLGIFLGKEEWHLAAGAGLLLALNVVCVDLAGNLMFWMKNIRPRTRPEKEQAARASVISLTGWVILLILLLLLFKLHTAAGLM